ncbi:hypothetical protein STCU_01643 [Strigomonas culicis]|nr:hypothetical protein STCU_01643 [Strigomonas culicis]|eukprot:EPY34327.1 hypothetical protein STCU_01643 [Strigomonas culicis]
MGLDEAGEVSPVEQLDQLALPESKRKSETGDEPAPKQQTAMVAEPQYRGSFWRHLLTLDLWLMWLTCYGLWGTGTVLNMNAAQIYRSINGSYDARRQTLYVALIGVGSATGRIISGLIDMRLTLARQRGQTQLQTTLFLPSGCAFLCTAYMFFTFVPSKVLVLPFLLGSIGSGLGWGLATLSIRIIYADDIGKHYNFMWSAGVVSTITLNRFMFGTMFDQMGRKFGTTPYCDVRICVRNQLLILMCVNVFCFCTGLLVHFRFSRYVQRVKRQQRFVDGSVFSGSDREPASTEAGVEMAVEPTAQDRQRAALIAAVAEAK